MNRLLLSKGGAAALSLCILFGVCRNTTAQPFIFEDVTLAAGVNVIHEGPGGGNDMRMGTGAVWFDYDKDGDLDLFMTVRTGSNRLFENNGDGTFTDVAVARGVDFPNSDAAGAVAADYDNDGDRDLYLANSDGDVLLRNNLVETGTPDFTDVTATAFPGETMPLLEARGTSASWGDYDNDGHLDLYVSHHLFVGADRYDYTADSQDRLYHNNGDGTFTDVSDLIRGPDDADGNDDLDGYGFIAAWTDYDNDGDIDIFMMNDCPFGTKGNKLWRNDGGTDPLAWNFTEVSGSIGLTSESLCVNAMGIGWGDYNRDGLWDYFYTDIGTATLIRNDGGGMFTDVTVEAGVFEDVVPGTNPPINRVTWGNVFLDYDLDGFQDIAVAAGTLGSSSGISPQPNILYHNEGDNTFTNVSTDAWLEDERRGRTIVMGDYDGDGDPDLMLVNYDQGNVLLQNTTANGNNWLILDLVGSVSNRDGLGAKVKVTSSDGVVQHYEIRSGSNLGGGDDIAAYFGFGDVSIDPLVDIEITWPSGIVQTLTGVDLTDEGGTGKRMTVYEPSFTAVASETGLQFNHDGQTSLDNGDMGIGTGAAWFDCEGDGDLDLYVTMRNGANRLFQNDGAGNFVNIASGDSRDSAHDGAGVSVADFDNDGDKDLYLANSDADVLLRNDGNCGFTDVTASAFPAEPTPFLEARGTSASWGDYDNDGNLDLYVANHLNMNATGPDDYAADSQDRLFHNNGDGTFTDVSDLIRGVDDADGNDDLDGYGFIAGWTDFDNDGDLDIFLMNDCPFGPKGNKLWRNDGGAGPLVWNFTEVSAAAGADQCQNAMGIGWGDPDRDGLSDYFFSNVGSATFLDNNGDGTFTDATVAAGLFEDTVPGSDPAVDRKTWGSVFFDLDLDGYQDLAVAAGVISDLSSTEPQPNMLYRNNGNSTFTNISDGSGFESPRRTRTVVMGDYDADGAPDLFMVNFGEAVSLVRNEYGGRTSNHWLIVDVEGAGPLAGGSNKDGVGAKVKVTTPDGVEQHYEVRSGSSLGGGDDVAAYFGLGLNTTADVEITWPSGVVQTLTGVTADQRLNVVEDVPDLVVRVTPVNPPIVIDAAGGSFDYDLFVANNAESSQSPQVWIVISGPGVSITRGPVVTTIGSGSFLLKTLTQDVPAGAPAGTYTVTGSVGSFPIADASDSFTFEKSAAKGSAGPVVKGWRSTLAEIAGDTAEAAAETTPERFELGANYPNPFNPTTMITYTLPEARPVTLRVYNVLGQEVARFNEGVREAGRHQVRFDASQLSAGVYVYVLEAGDFKAMRRMVLLK